MTLDIPPLLNRPKPLRYEEFKSYLERLRVANGYGEKNWLESIMDSCNRVESRNRKNNHFGQLSKIQFVSSLTLLSREQLEVMQLTNCLRKIKCACGEDRFRRRDYFSVHSKICPVCYKENVTLITTKFSLVTICPTHQVGLIDLSHYSLQDLHTKIQDKTEFDKENFSLEDVEIANLELVKFQKFIIACYLGEKDDLEFNLFRKVYENREHQKFIVFILKMTKFVYGVSEVINEKERKYNSVGEISTNELTSILVVVNSIIKNYDGNFGFYLEQVTMALMGEQDIFQKHICKLLYKTFPSPEFEFVWEKLYAWLFSLTESKIAIFSVWIYSLKSMLLLKKCFYFEGEIADELRTYMFVVRNFSLRYPQIHDNYSRKVIDRSSGMLVRVYKSEFVDEFKKFLNEILFMPQLEVKYQISTIDIYLLAEDGFLIPYGIPPKWYFFEKSQVQEFENQFIYSIPVLKSLSKNQNLISLEKAFFYLRRTNISLPFMLHRIKQERILAYRKANLESIFHDIYLPKTDVICLRNSKLYGLEDGCLMSDACEIIGCRAWVVKKLVSLGYIRQLSAPQGKNYKYVYSESQIRSFAEKYTLCNAPASQMTIDSEDNTGRLSSEYSGTYPRIIWVSKMRFFEIKQK